MRVSRTVFALVGVGALLSLTIPPTAKAFAPATSKRIQYNASPCWGKYQHRWQVDSAEVVLFSSLNDNDSPSTHDDWIGSCRLAIATALMGITLFCTPPSPLTHYSLSAWAVEIVQQQVVVLEPTAAAAALAIDDLPSPQELVNPFPKKQEESAIKILQPVTVTATKIDEETYSPVDEVWNLVNKYYIDRTFGDQDWNDVHQKYKALESKQGSKNAMKVTTEMVKTLGDKYSRVLDGSQYAAIQKFDLIGVGVTLMPNDSKDIIVGAPPVAGSASAQAGMKVGDQVLAVNGVPTKGRSAFDIIDQISDNPNVETVTMTVRSPNDEEGRDIVMERAFRQVSDPIRFKITETRPDGTKVGFIRVLEFNSLVKARLEDAFESLQKEGANAFVIDLRGNPGGAFQSAVEISSLFLDNKVATTVVDSNGVELSFRTFAGRVVVDPKAPLAMWIDGGSASASEVLAGSLHDNCRAVIMGDQSFGKGLIQAVYGLRNGAGLVLTVARYVTPNGTEIQGSGVTPDIKGNVPLYFPGFSTDTSKVDFAAISKRLDPSMCHAPQK